MDPVSLAMFGGLVAAIPTALMAGVIAPRAAVGAVTPPLEMCRQHLRREETISAQRAEMKEIVEILAAVPTAAEEEEVNGVLDAVDWALFVNEQARTHNLPVGPASLLRVETQVYPLPPQQGVLLTEGEKGVLTALLGHKNKRKYALALRRLMQWGQRRKAVLGL